MKNFWLYLRGLLGLFLLIANVSLTYAQEGGRSLTNVQEINVRAEKTPSIIDSLLHLPKYRCVFHDSYARVDSLYQTGTRDKYVCWASEKEIGNNNYSEFSKGKLIYHTLASSNATMAVGVRRVFKNGIPEFFACNNTIKGPVQRVIKSIDTGTPYYRFTFKKGPSSKSVSKVAFWIKDIDNYFYIKLSSKRIELHKVIIGKDRIIEAYNNKGFSVITVDLSKGNIEIRSDTNFLTSIDLKEDDYTNICGILFTSNENTEISSFVVERKDTYIKYALEQPGSSANTMNDKDKRFLVEAEDKTILLVDGAFRFSLDYEKDYKKHLVSSGRRSEISIIAKEVPLDSWIATFDVFFPGNGSEYYEKDDNPEVIFQTHDRKAGFGLSPQIAIRVLNNEIYCSIRTREALLWKNEGVSKRKHLIAKLVDNDDEIKDNSILSLMRGLWNNVIISVKEGYLPEHNPKIVIFLNGVKVLEDNMPNAYNAGSFGSYIKLGIYKSAWNTDKLDSHVRSRVIYIDNIEYYR